MDARAGLGDLLRLGARLGGSLIGRKAVRDPAAVTCRWARELMQREGASALRLALGRRAVELVADPTRSETVLGAQPGVDGWAPSPLKTEAMGFLAPRALTVADGADWTRLRAFNEQVLAPGRTHPYAATFLDHVRRAFERPVADLEDVQRAMGRAMVGIVLGNAAEGDDPADDVTVLFGLVQSPLKRKLTGFLHNGRRERLYRLLRRAWDGARTDDPTLIALARARGGELDPDEVLQQVPHWMFTFTGSGTDLLARTLALVTARPAAAERLRAEVASVAADTVEGVERLRYLEACILETGRLFPPVTRTFHRAAGSSAGGDVVHWFPLLQRADALGPSVHEFRPERWLEPSPDAPALASNLFLRGPRRCPGSTLILFVCRAALARQIGELGVVARAPDRLAHDPLPVSFPAGTTRFLTRRTA